MESGPSDIYVSCNFSTDNNDKDTQLTKLHEDLAAISIEWQDKKGEDIYRLRMALQLMIQTERERIARIESVPQDTIINEQRTQINRIAPNTKIRCQI
ncbi:6133_t:CDS:1, partial [Scutellospora calospora]